jgi:hypothetical protein
VSAHTHISISMGLSMMDCGHLIMINMVMKALQQQLKSGEKNFKARILALSSSMLATN